jgi:peptidoglycan/xylan/chitin deacetylase (PgdA/CDA1 family)
VARTRFTLLGCLALALLAGCGSGSSPGSGTRPTAAKATAHHPHHVRATRRIPTLVPPASPPANRVRVPVLTYHRVVPVTAVGELDLKVDPANFAAEMQALVGHGYHAITQTQLFRALYDHAALPAQPVIISVDDGYVDDVRTILPILQRLHLVGTFFVITGRMTEPGFLSAAQIRRLDRAGMDVEDHTAHHVDLRLLTGPELAAETGGSRQVLERVLGHPVYAFAYPFGYYNSTVIDAVRAAGYIFAYTTDGGITETTTAPFAFPRIHVGRSLTPSGLLAELGGA